MKIRICYIFWGLTLLFLMGSIPLSAQLQFPGKPLGISSGLKAADVLYVLPPADPMEIEAARELNRRSNSKPLHFALERPVNLTPESHGSWSREGNLNVWRVHVLSPGAFSLGLVFGKFELLPGVKLFVYDPAMQEVKGAYTSANNKASGILPVGHLPGVEVLIEMQVPEAMTSYGELELQSLSHAFLNTGFKSTRANCPAGDFGCSQACEIDINCVEGDGWERVRPSVVRINTPTLWCTGVLVNNTAYDSIPYIITAEHCLNTQYYADLSVFQFNYESAECFGEDGPLDMSIAGADYLTHGDSLDFSLIRLSEIPPASFGAYYAGWDRSTFQTTATATIHHPFGDVKKISHDADIPSIPAQPGDVPYNGLEDYHYFSYWWVRNWEVGSTEGGSSGGPLFNQARRVIGTLSGGNAACGDSIDYDAENDRVIYNPAPNYDDYFTRFGMAWDYEEEKGNALKSWLDPENLDPMTLGGFDPTSTEPTQFEQGSRFQVFPNPASDRFYITSKEALSADASYSLVNLSGALVLRGQLQGEGTVEIQCASLPAGIYLLTICDDSYRERHKLMMIAQ
jgi:lysyl endopeptidase